MPTPEEDARLLIDAKLTASGWIPQTYREMNLAAGPGLAVAEFPGARGKADYLLYLDGKAIGVVEAKPVGHTLSGVEGQSASYADGLAAQLPAWQRPLPFQYESTGKVTQFTNLMEPHSRSREIFSFHRPESLREMVLAEKPLRAWLREMPPVPADGLWPKQLIAINNLEQNSLRLAKPKALIQMATGSGKTFTAANIAYRLIKYGHARRVCFLVDRTNLGIQTLKEFQQYQPPGERHTFDKLYNIAFPRKSNFDPVNRVLVTTIQRLYATLTRQELAEEDEEQSGYENPGSFKKPPVPILYNELIPPEFFDVLIVDECHRSIYNVWGDVLKYFDSFLIGLTATPSKQTIGFFNQNLVMEYTHEQAVADRVNVPYDVYRIETQITKSGSTVDAGFFVGKRSRKTRAERQEALDDDMAYRPDDLDRAVVAEDQIRTIIQTFRDKLFTEIFPGRTEVPKTIIFAKDDSHADDIVKIVREEFGRGNDFCQKITYRTGVMRVTDQVTDADGIVREVARYEKIKGKTGEDVLIAFRNSFNPRIAVTVDMIATGTDVKPVEIVFFLRSIKSSNYFEQMKGRGARVMDIDALKGVTPDAEQRKSRFVIIDAVGVCAQSKCERGPLDREPKKTLKQVFDYVKAGGTEPDAASALTAKLNRLSAEMSPKQQEEVRRHANGESLDGLVAGLVNALDDNAVEAKTRELNPGTPTLNETQLDAAEQVLIKEAFKPFYDPNLRRVLLEIKQENEQTIDRVSKDVVLSAGFSQEALDKAKVKIASFRQFIADHKDELVPLQVFYGQATPDRLRFRDLKELAELIKRPPVAATPEELWFCFETLEKDKVKGRGGKIITDLVSLIRHALQPNDILAPFASTVQERYEAWLARQAAAGKTFTAEQTKWLDKIADHIATSLAIEMDDFQDGWFAQRGSLGKAHELFGDSLGDIVADMNRVLTA